MSLLMRNISIDTGVNETRVYLHNKDLLISEPTILVYNKKKRLIAAGEQARNMPGRTPKGVSVVFPVTNGIITDAGAQTDLLKNLLGKIKVDTSGLFKDRAVVCAPYGINDIERIAIMTAVMSLGNLKVEIVDKILAAAMGEGITCETDQTTMLVNIGEGTCETALVSKGGVVTGKSIRLGSGSIDAEIMMAVRKKYGVLISRGAAESIKIEIGSVFDKKPGTSERSMAVKGRNLYTGLPCEIQVTEQDIKPCIDEVMEKIMEAVIVTLQKTPTELLQYIKKKGILLTGGGSLIKGLDQLIYSKTKIAAYQAKDPLYCTVKGALAAYHYMKKRSGKKIK